MLFATGFNFLLIALTLLLGFPAIWLAATGLCPGRVSRAKETFRRGFWRPFLWGILPFGVGLAILGAIGSIPGIGPIFGLIGLAALVFAAQVGVAGISGLIGERVSDGEGSGFEQQKRGAVILVLTFLLPILGWLILPVATTIAGLGALLTRAPKEPADSEAAALISTTPPELPRQGADEGDQEEEAA